jgi:LPS-assembly lipoprotein
MRVWRLGAVVPALLLLSGCGLQPLYGGGARMGAGAALGQVEVAKISGQNGWLMRKALADRLPNTGASARYRLVVRLDDKLEGLGLLSNDTVGRERRTLRARYQLVDNASGAVVLDATAGSDAGLDLVSSEYAVVAAEQTALENLIRVVADKIVTNLAVELRRRPAQGAATKP